MSKGIEISAEEKVRLVEEHLSGRLSLRRMAREAGVSKWMVEFWVSRYRAEGVQAFQPERKRRTYSAEIKRAAVEDYLNGDGSLRSVSEKYKIRSCTQLLEWIKVYNRHRETKENASGGICMAKSRKFTLEERVKVVQEYMEKGKSYEEVAKEYGVGYHLVYNWVKKYREKGPAGLEDRRGQRAARQTPRTPEEELRIRVAQLEQENYLLKMERDLLKKVKEWERGER